jgi:hypothetical protein
VNTVLQVESPAGWEEICVGIYARFFTRGWLRLGFPDYSLFALSAKSLTAFILDCHDHQQDTIQHIPVELLDRFIEELYDDPSLEGQTALQSCILVCKHFRHRALKLWILQAF